MPVVLIDETVKVPKELNEVRTALVGLIADIKAGKDIATIATENLGALVAAVGGADQLDDEVKEALKESITCIALMGSDIVGMLAKKAE